MRDIMHAFDYCCGANEASAQLIDNLFTTIISSLIELKSTKKALDVGEAVESREMQVKRCLKGFKPKPASIMAARCEKRRPLSHFWLRSVDANQATDKSCFTLKYIKISAASS